MQTIVINNRESLVIGQMPHHGKDSSGVPVLGEAVTFIPGVNLVPSEKLAILRKNPQFELNFTTVIESSPAPEQNPEKVGKPILVVQGECEDASPLAKLKPKGVEALVAETFRADLLQNWLKEEGRQDVRAVIQNQLDKLRTGDTKGGPAGGLSSSKTR